jgi:tRNA(Ile)-lysidine synthase
MNGVGIGLMEEKILAFCKKHHLLEENKTVLVAVSGGPDSMVLLHFLTSIRKERGLSLVAISIDHQIRGEESRQDVEYVKRVCEEWKVPFVSGQVNVPLYQKETKKSTELAARELRYQFFAKQMEKYPSPLLAMGHHGDDQVETMFMQLMRGVKPKGMPYQRSFANGKIIRPLLCLTKEEILNYCHKYHIQPRFDATNNDTIYTRNAFRHELLPFLKKFNPNIHRSLQNNSEWILEEEDYLTQEAEKVVKQVADIKDNSKQIHIHLHKLFSFHQTLQRRAFHLILNYLYRTKHAEIQAIHVEQIFKLIHSNKPNGEIHLPEGLLVTRVYDELHFQFLNTDQVSYSFELSPGDSVKLPNGLLISLEQIHQDTKPKEFGPNELVCDAFNVKLPLVVRTRKPGDKLKVRGLGGRKKIKDIFIDEKIPMKKRDEWPIVTDKDGNVLWLVGLKKGEINDSPFSNKWIRLQSKHTDI